MQDLCEPFIAKWDLQIKSLRAQLEKEEPYAVYNAVETNRKLFGEESKEIETLLYRKKTKP